MTNVEKISYLNGYKYAVMEERRLRAEIEQWRSRAERVTPSMTGMPGGGQNANAPFVSAAESIARLELQLAEQLKRCVLMRQQIDAAIAQIQQPRLRRLLILRYVEAQTFEQIAIEMYMDYRWVRRLHACAIENLTLESPYQNVI